MFKRKLTKKLKLIRDRDGFGINYFKLLFTNFQMFIKLE